MKIGDRRLLKLADHLESQHRGLQRFDFGSVCTVRSCGSAGCAIGEMPAVWPKSWEWNDGNTQVTQPTFLRPCDAPYDCDYYGRAYMVVRAGSGVRDSCGWDGEDVQAWFGIDEEIARILFLPSALTPASVNGVEIYGNHARASAEDVAKTIRQVVAARNPKTRKTKSKKRKLIR